MPVYAFKWIPGSSRLGTFLDNGGEGSEGSAHAIGMPSWLVGPNLVMAEKSKDSGRTKIRALFDPRLRF
jgi:hypothetical protein